MDNSWDSITSYSNPEPQQSDWSAVSSYSSPQSQNEPDWSSITQYGGGQTQTAPQDPWGDFQQKAIQTIQGRGLPSAVVPVLLGQAALESARGKSAPGGNYFGIKGKGTAGSNNLATQEYGNGGYYGENSNFRAYNTPEESINDYLDLITRYRGVPEAIASNDPARIIQAIKNAGYATSPTYVQNVMGTPEYRQHSATRLW